MSSLSAALTQLNSSHTVWVSKSDLTEEEMLTDHVKYNTSWLEQIWSETDDLQDSVDDALETLKPKPPQTKDKIAALQEQLESLKIDTASRLDMLKTKTDKSAQILNSDSIKAYQDLLRESQRQLTVDIPSMVQNLSTLDPERSSGHSSDLEQFKRAN